MTLEELQNKVLELSEQKRLLEEDKKSLETKLSEIEGKYSNLEQISNKRIQDLQEHNQKLFLRVAHQKKEESTVDKDFKSKLLGDYTDFLDENEKELLKDIEEGI